MYCINNKTFFILLILVLCFSMLLTGCADGTSQESAGESREREEQEKQIEKEACGKFVIKSRVVTHKDFSAREEIEEKVNEVLTLYGITGKCTVTLEYAHKFDPKELEEKGFDVEYPEYETGYYEATLDVAADDIGYNLLYECASHESMKTVSVYFHAEFPEH